MHWVIKRSVFKSSILYHAAFVAKQVCFYNCAATTGTQMSPPRRAVPVNYSLKMQPAGRAKSFSFAVWAHWRKDPPPARIWMPEVRLPLTLQTVLLIFLAPAWYLRVCLAKNKWNKTPSPCWEIASPRPTFNYNTEASAGFIRGLAGIQAPTHVTTVPATTNAASGESLARR